MMGKGKYDDICTQARVMSKAVGLLLIVLEGEKGSGFSCQAPPHLSKGLPEMLRNVAEQIENDLKHQSLVAGTAQDPSKQ